MTPLVTTAVTVLLTAGTTVLVSLPDSTVVDPPRSPVTVPSATIPDHTSARPQARTTTAPSDDEPAGRRSGAVAAEDPSGAAPATVWRWPLLVTPQVVRGFEPPPKPWLPGHRGVDLAAVPGDVVVAAGAGTITYAGPLAGRGVITVWHGELRTTYEPVTATVEVGDHVGAGDQIGVLAAGSSHCGGVPPCLHWGLLRGTTYLDPLLLLGLSHPILLPIPN